MVYSRTPPPQSVQKGKPDELRKKLVQNVDRTVTTNAPKKQEAEEHEHRGPVKQALVLSDVVALLKACCALQLSRYA